MPPSAKITKQQIVDAAYTILRREGMESLNARYLAKQLHCSTQPLFRLYESMDGIKQDATEKAAESYNNRMMNGLNHPIPFLGMGLAYIQFAREEKNLFHLLFMQNSFTIQSFDELLQGEDNQQIITMIGNSANLPEDAAKRLFLSNWLLVHGIACMLATNQADIPALEIETILKNGYLGFLTQEKENLNHEKNQH